MNIGRNRSVPPTQLTKIKILIVDNLPHVRQGLRTVLQLIDDLEIVGEAANGLEAVQLAEQFRPDVVVMDLEMPVMDGFEASRQLKERYLAGGVVVLTIHGNRQAREWAIKAGVDAFIEKGATIETLVEAIREVCRTNC